MCWVVAIIQGEGRHFSEAWPKMEFRVEGGGEGAMCWLVETCFAHEFSLVLLYCFSLFLKQTKRLWPLISRSTSIYVSPIFLTVTSATFMISFPPWFYISTCSFALYISIDRYLFPFLWAFRLDLTYPDRDPASKWSGSATYRHCTLGAGSGSGFELSSAPTLAGLNIFVLKVELYEGL